MNIATIVAATALAVIVFLALRYIIKEKLKGTKCIGCPYAEGCSSCGSEENIEAIVEKCRASSEKL